MAEKVMGNDMDVMARTVFGEARGQPQQGKRAVAFVILNRWRSPKWFTAESIAAVCQKPYQFSCWNKNDPNRNRIINAAYTERELRACLRACLDAFDKPDDDPTKGSTHYYAPKSVGKPKWAVGKEPAVEIGDHVFYSGID